MTVWKGEGDFSKSIFPLRKKFSDIAWRRRLSKLTLWETCHPQWKTIYTREKNCLLKLLSKHFLLAAYTKLIDFLSPFLLIKHFLIFHFFIYRGVCVRNTLSNKSTDPLLFSRRSVTSLIKMCREFSAASFKNWRPWVAFRTHFSSKDKFSIPSYLYYQSLYLSTFDTNKTKHWTG